MYVTPKSDCPHIDISNYISIETFKTIEFDKLTCQNCEEKSENWVCLACGNLYCSRYINSHYLGHYSVLQTHSICLSMMDLSFWCYECNSYIINKQLNKYYKIVSDYKFGNNFMPTLDNVTTAMECLNLDADKVANIKYFNFIEMLKAGKFKRISFMTGAGISTTAGIPDFRSSGSGLFKTLQTKYNLETPEQFFDISFFKEKPELFYEFAKEFDVAKYKATPTHWFMSFLHHKGMLNLIFTQNIDSLELNAKIPSEKVVFAHGNLSEAHCSGCNKDCDYKLLESHINQGKVLYCTDETCKAPLKPKVVFYGESLPKNFFMKQEEFKSSDLGIIMGTSLKVMPFNFLPYYLKKNKTWRVVMNKERVGDEDTKDGFDYDDVTSSDMFLEGSTDEQVLKIITDCDWKEEFDQFVKDHSN